jgi:hypothetical protein
VAADALMPAHGVCPSWACTLLAVACGGACATALEAQSLADIARAEAERRKSIAQPSRVYTNKDLKPVRPPAGAVQAGERGAAPRREHQKGADNREAAATPTDPSARGPAHDSDESRWRRRMADARERAERSRTFAEALQSRINALTTDFSARDDPAARAAIRTELDKALAELARVRGEIAEQDEAITGLEEEARRAGVPPGWIR